MAIKSSVRLVQDVNNPTVEKTKATTSNANGSRISVSLPPELLERVKKYRFTNEKSSVSAVVQEALEAYLPK